jgi:LCP family protein required for cell wall assembly
VKLRRLAAAAAVVSLTAWAAISVTSDIATTQASAGPLLQLAPAHPGEHVPAVDGTDPVFFLVLGNSTARTVEESNISDSIHIVGYNPEQNEASILGIPRDLWVPIPGHGTTKINAATEYGGSKLMVQTVEDLTGIPIDYVASTGFTTFRTIISDLNGVVVKVPYAINDSHTGLNVNAGKEDMNGKEALDFARSRYGVPNGDFSRSENQGIILQGLQSKLVKEFKKNPGRILDWLGTGLRNTANEIPFDELVKLAFAAAKLPPKGVAANCVVPGEVANVGGISIVREAATAPKVYKDMAKDGLVKCK